MFRKGVDARHKAGHDEHSCTSMTIFAESIRVKNTPALLHMAALCKSASRSSAIEDFPCP
jgi:hypothetical protein